MNAKLKSILNRAWNEPRWFAFWLAFFCLLCAVALLALASVSLFEVPLWGRRIASGLLVMLLVGLAAGIAGFVLSFLPLFSRLLGWTLRRRFFLVASLGTIVALFYAEENWRGTAAWERFQREAAKKGYTYDPAALAPPAVPDDQNFALAPIVMSGYIATIDLDGRKQSNTNAVNRLDMPLDANLPELRPPAAGNWQKAERTDWKAWQEYYRRLAARTNLFAVPDQPGEPAADALFAWAKYDAAIEELRQAARRPYSRFPLEYQAENPAAVLLPHLVRLRSCAHTLRMRACAELQLGRTDQALDDIRLMLRLSESVHNEPLLISQLVRLVTIELALQPVWEGLADHRWSEPQLAALEMELNRLDFFPDYSLAMRGEQAWGAGVIEYVRRTREPWILSDEDADLVAFLLNLVPGGWFKLNQVHYARLMDEQYVNLADPRRRIFPPAAVHRAEDAQERETQSRNPCKWMQRYLLPALGNVVRRFAGAQAQVDLARVGCALERCRLADGRLPETLDALAPRILPAVPHDIINGQALVYRPQGDGRYIVYSVGWNEADDGGKVGLQKNGQVNRREGDWVFGIYD